jgi:hypothetical protein
MVRLTRNRRHGKPLELERKKRMLGIIPETAKVVLGDYLARKEN